jgi:predicted nucleotidyltransferase
VDLLVELERPAGLFPLARLQSYLSQLLGRQVDPVTRNSLKRQFRDRVLHEAIDVN